MKKIVKRSLALVFVVALVLSMMVVPASALNNLQVEMDTSYLSKEKCWTEAAKYMDASGLSQARIARELYTHALADNIGYKINRTSTLRDFIINSLSANGTTSASGWSTLSDRLDDLGNYLVGRGHVVEIGSDAWYREQAYYLAWRGIDIYGYDTYYTIHSKLDFGKVIDVNGNYDSNGAKIQLYDDNGSRAQKFAIYFKDDGWCNIFKKDTFKCLDVSGGVADSEVKVQLYDYNGTAAQDWKFIKAEGTYYYIQNRLGYYLDACGASTKNGTQIWTYTLNQTDAQKWGLTLAQEWAVYEP